MALIEFQRAVPGPAFASGLAKSGGRTAVVTTDGDLSYAELDQRVRAVAARLEGPRRLTLLTVGNSVDSLIGYLAALRAGHPLLLTAEDDALSREQLVRSYDPDIIVVSSQEGLRVEERRTSTAHDLHPDLALMLSTSGSTGSPKLVRLSHRNLESNAAAISEYLQLTPEDRAITSLPMQYSYGLSVINSHLRVGASLVLTELSVVDRCFWDLFTATRATSFAGVPHTFDLLDRVGFERMSVPSLRYVTQAGGSMRPEQVRRYAQLGARDGWRLFVMYGQTEATARMAYLPPQLASRHPDTVGIAIPGGRLSVDAPDESGVGELVYRGENVMLGYAEQSSDLALGPVTDELRTGDLARTTADGLCQIVGRASRFIKPFGLRIDLAQAEELLTQGGITAACTGDDRMLVAAVESEAAMGPAEEVLTSLGLPRSHVRVVGVTRLPRLPNGKLDYGAVGRLADGVHPATAIDSERGSQPTRRGPDAVRGLFNKVLGVEPHDEDTFVSLGGDSLSYVEMSICLEELLGTLPRDWHVTPVRNLVPARGERRFLVRTDTSAVLRAISIVLIVGTHAKLWQVTGGAHVLLAVAGFNFARFQLRSTTPVASVARVAVPSMVWISIVAAVSTKYGWPNALLINGLVERPQDHWGYWFLEALIQILIPLTGLLAIPAVARLERRRPLALPAAALAAGLLFRFDLIELTTTFPISRPHEVFWVFALGWAAARAASWPSRAALSAVALIAVPGFFDETSRGLIVLAGLGLVLWLPTISLPKGAPRLVAPLAGASLYIYLTHFQVYPPLQRLAGPAVAVAGSLLVGIAAGTIARRLLEQAERALRRERTLAA